MSMGLTQINSLLNSANTMQHVADLDKSRVLLKRHIFWLEEDIEIAKKAGADTTKLEERYSKMEDRLDANEEDAFTTAKDLMERVAEDNEKIREEEIEQARAEKAEREESTKNDDDIPLAPAAVLELSDECLAINNNDGEQSVESGVSGEGKPAVGNAVEKKIKTSAVSPVEHKMRAAAAAYAKGRSTGDAAVH